MHARKAREKSSRVRWREGMFLAATQLLRAVASPAQLVCASDGHLLVAGSVAGAGGGTYVLVGPPNFGYSDYDLTNTLYSSPSLFMDCMATVGAVGARTVISNITLAPGTSLAVYGAPHPPTAARLLLPVR